MGAKKKEIKDIDKHIIEEYKIKRILYFPWSSSNEDKNIKHLKISKNYFEGEFNLKFDYAKLSEDLTGIKKKIEETDAIYFPGG